MSDSPAESTIKSLIPFLFVFLWSTGFIGAKYALPYIEPFNLLFIRMVLVSIAFIVLIIIFKANWPSLEQARHSAISGLLIHGFYLGGVFTAIKLGMPAGVTSIIVGLQPVVTAILSYRFLDATLTKRQIIGLVLGFIGVVMVILSTNSVDQNSITAAGLIACTVSLLSISVGSLYQKKYCGNTDLLTGSFWQYIATAIMMGLLTSRFEAGYVVWNKTLILALTWLVFGLSVGAILLLMYMIREGESAKVASYFYLVPVVVCIETWILFDERLTWTAIFSMILTVYGVYLVVSRSNSAAAKSS